MIRKRNCFSLFKFSQFSDSMISIVICGVVDFGASLDNLSFVVRSALSSEQFYKMDFKYRIVRAKIICVYPVHCKYV